jgi:hypothetical protein
MPAKNQLSNSFVYTTTISRIDFGYPGIPAFTRGKAGYIYLRLQNLGAGFCQTDS